MCQGNITLGYQVVENGLSVAGAGRRSYFEPLSRLQPCVEEGSAAEKEFSAKLQEQRRKAVEASARQQEQRRAQVDAVAALGLRLQTAAAAELNVEALDAAAATDNLVVTINGVHRVVVTAIAKLGGALLVLPPQLEVLELCFEAQGTAQAPAIALVK